MNARIVGPLFQQNIRLFLRFLKVADLNQQVCQLDSSPVILGAQFDGAV